MASRAPSVGADMLPLSQRRPRTLLPAAGASERESNFPSHSSSFPQQPARVWFKIWLLVNKHPSARFTRRTHFFCDLTTPTNVTYLDSYMNNVRKNYFAQNKVDSSKRAIWSNWAACPVEEQLSDPGEEKRKENEKKMQTRDEERRRGEARSAPSSALTMAVNGCAPRSLGQSKHTAPF